MAKYAIVCLGVIGVLGLGAPVAAQPAPSSDLVMVDLQSGQGVEGLPEFSPSAIIVKFDANTPDTERWRIIRTHGCWMAGSCEGGDFHLVGIPAGAGPLPMVEIFAQYECVEYAEPDYYVQAMFVPDDKLYTYQWNLNNALKADIRLEEAWDIEEGDPNVIVAVIDTGVAYEDFDIYRQAPDLANTRFVPGYDFVHDDDHPNDDQGHGTHVAGTIAQSTNNGIGVAGIAFRCSIMPVKALDEDGVGGAFTLARAILFAVEHGARVINLSVGSPSSSRTLHNAVKTAYERGVTVVAAAGNDYARGNRPSYPAADQDYCIGVGAVRFDLTRAPYSNTGSYVFTVAPGGDVRVDQNADGYPDGILQQTFRTDPSRFAYWFFQGTSMAAPHVSGVAALLASRGVTRPDKIREALQRTARDLGPRGWDAEYGWGLIDAHAALAYRVPGDLDGDNVVDGTRLFGSFSLESGASDRVQ
jgi:serine protease